jgi:hypothetical protein
MAMEHGYVLRVIAPESEAYPDHLAEAYEAIESVLGRKLSFSRLGAAADSNRRVLIKEAMATTGFPPVVEDPGISSPSVMLFLGSGKVFQRGLHIEVAASIAEGAAGVDLLVNVARALRGHWGYLDTKANFRVNLAPQPARLVQLGIAPRRPAGLPTLDGKIGGCPPALPFKLAWINYWSPDAASAAGINRPSGEPKGGSPSTHSLGDGSWLVGITDEPLDPWRPEHAQRLAAGYECFPKVGRSCG